MSSRYGSVSRWGFAVRSIEPTRCPSYEGGGLLDLVWPTAGNEINTNTDPKSSQRMMRLTRSASRISLQAELTLMRAGKCEMSCFFAPLAQVNRGKSTQMSNPTLEYSFVRSDGIEVLSAFITGWIQKPPAAMKPSLEVCRANR